jgi:hypothetical protein
MNVLASLGFWVTFAVIFAVGLVVIMLHNHVRHNSPKQRHGVQPNEQPKLIVTDIGPDGFANKMTRAHHVTTDPQAYADIFVPSGRKD